MDPVTAVSLTAAIVTLVDASIKVVVKFEQLRKQGVTNDRKQFADDAVELGLVTMNVRRTVQNIRQQTPDDLQLIDLAFNCSETGLQLEAEVRKITAPSNVVGKALRSLKHANSIKKLRARLEEH